MKSLIYLDNNATTPIAPEVVTAMEPFFYSAYFNPSSAYEPAKAVRSAIEKSREEVASLLGAATAKEIIWMSCATESINAAIFGAARACPQRRHIITTSVEHPAVLEVCRELQRQGYEVTFLGVNRRGEIDLPTFVRALRRDTLLVSIMHANNETGVIFPIERLSRITKETDSQILFHCDATQTVTKLPIILNTVENFSLGNPAAQRGGDIAKGEASSPPRLGVENLRHVDLLSFSGHKFHAPKGVGALFVRRGTPCRPFLLGGHQESGRRGGTENVAFIVGMARAMTLAAENHHADEMRVLDLRDKLERGLVDRIPFLEINGGGAPRMPGTLNVACYSIEGESILYLLSEAGICASSGSACTSGSLEPSHVLSAMGVPFAAMHGSVRLSISRYNTEEEIDTVLEILPDIVNKLRNASPFWDKENNCPKK